jgi:tRNA-Thr(GGU) m(6)t(6)A37 methyltransferase TsaA
MEMEPIGIIHSPFKKKQDCPIQPIFAQNARGKIEIFKEYQDGLKDIDLFTHIYILYLFDRAGDIQLVRPTFLDDTPHGIYASRHPCRPNGIGMSIVGLESLNDNVLDIQGVDVLDGTPLLDIKPYIPKFDIFESASNGWVADKSWRSKPSNRE